MADIVQSAVHLEARIVAINEELKVIDVEGSTDRREFETRDKERLARKLTLRVEREGLSKLRDNAKVAERVATHEQAAAKARSDAETLLKDLQAQKVAQDERSAEIDAKGRKVDELLAKLEAKDISVPIQ